MKPFAWWNPSGGINALVLDYQKEDMRPERAAEYSVPLFREGQEARGMILDALNHGTGFSQMMPDGTVEYTEHGRVKRR